MENSTTPAAATAPKRRGRPPRIESFSEWMARLDTEVEAMTQKVYKRPPADGLLNGAQRRVSEMLIEYCRSLRRLRSGESPFDICDYDVLNLILQQLLLARNPNWRPAKNGARQITDLPREEAALYRWIMYNCAGPADGLARTTTDDDE